LKEVSLGDSSAEMLHSLWLDFNGQEPPEAEEALLQRCVALDAWTPSASPLHSPKKSRIGGMAMADLVKWSEQATLR